MVVKELRTAKKPPCKEQPNLELLNYPKIKEFDAEFLNSICGLVYNDPEVRAISRYSRQKQHVLLSIDVEKSDRATRNRLCTECTRSDQDYGLAWIKEYGKGRTYMNALGHTDVNYTDPRFTSLQLAGIQYILGDLEADATPSAKFSKK